MNLFNLIDGDWSSHRDKLIADIDSHFSGPDSYWLAAIDRTCQTANSNSRERVLAFVAWCNAELKNESWKARAPQWNVMQAYANLRLGDDSQPALKAFSVAITNICKPASGGLHSISTSGLIREYDRAIDYCSSMMLTLKKDVWTFEEFVLISMIQDLVTGAGNSKSQRRTESIPILLGSANNEGIALDLVAEQIPGPPGMIVPHWIKLGMACMGDKFVVSHEIGSAMKRTASGIAIRWWLKPRLGQWHKSIIQYEKKSGAVSTTIPAACLSRALDEIAKTDSIPSPVFHPSIAVSGELIDGNPIVCGEVGLHRAKVKAATQSGIRTLLFGRLSNVAEQAALDNEFSSADCKTRWVSTLDEAYRQMLRSSTIIEQAKKKVCVEWEWNQLEVDTHESFFEVTENARDFDRPKAAPSLSPIEFQGQEIEIDPSSWRLVSLDNVFNEDGTLWVNEKSLPKSVSPNFFLVRQPFWYDNLDSNWEPREQWDVAVQEEEPEIPDQESGMKAPRNDADEIARERGFRHEWQRLTREHLLQCALTSDPSWKTVAVVCGAGLGKTTNLKYLETLINRQWDHRGEYFALFVELSDLGTHKSRNDFFASQQNKLADLLDAQTSKDEIQFAWNRMYESGKILFLIDSLDQADHSNGSEGLARLEQLIAGPCKVWLSGRSHAFRSAKERLCNMPKSPWRFLRVGQLDEPEARQLIETGAYVRPLFAKES